MKDARLQDRLKEALNIRNMKAVDLCEKTEIPKSAISYYMAGKSEPRADRLYLIAKALDVSETWLMGYNVSMERTQAQKTNDAMADIVVRMRTDQNFFSLIERINNLDDTQLKAIETMILAFDK